MKDYIVVRVYQLAEYIVLTKKTVRQTGKEFNVSKSTVHKDVTERLYQLDKTLYKQVKRVLNTNFDERHIRGGLATQKKYKK